MMLDLQEAVAGFVWVGRLVTVHWILTAAVLALVSVALRCLPRASAATRHGSWLAALLLCAVLPLGACLGAAGLLPERALSDLRLLGSVSADSPTSQPLQEARTDETGGAVASDGPGGRPATPEVAASSGRPGLAAVELLASNVVALLENAFAQWLFVTVGLVWLVAVSWRMTRLGVAWRRTSRLRSRTLPPRPELRRRMERIVCRVAPGEGPQRTVDVAELPESVAFNGPFCVGARHPCVVVPVTWLEASAIPDQDVALLHEAAHGMRRDGVALIVQQMASCLLPFHPFVRRALRRIEIEREAACDDFVLRSGISARRYGASLLRQAENCLRSDVPPTDSLLHTAYLGSASQLARRLLAMTDPRRSRSNRPQWVPTLVIAVVLGGAAAVSLAAWPTFSRSGDLSIALVGTALEEEHGGRGSRHRHESWHRGHGHDHDYEGRTVLNADDSSLYPAVRRGDVERMERLLDAGEDVNEVWPGDGTPLMVAAHQGDLDMVDTLLRRGADVDLAVGGDGIPLIGAARSGNLDLVQLLLDAGAAIDDSGFGGDGNPLIAASLAGDIGTARFLVQRGATVDIHVPDDDTPLINAAQQGHLDMVRYLLDEGADPNLTGDHDRRLDVVRTPLNQAEKGGHHDVAQLLRAAGARG